MTRPSWSKLSTKASTRSWMPNTLSKTKCCSMKTRAQIASGGVSLNMATWRKPFAKPPTSSASTICTSTGSRARHSKITPLSRTGTRKMSTSIIGATIIDVLIFRVPVRDNGVIFEWRAREPVEVQMVDADDVGGFAKGFLHVAIFKDTPPDAICARVFMEQHFVFESVFGIHDRVEAFVLNLDQLGRVIGNMRRSSDHRGDRLTL